METGAGRPHEEAKGTRAGGHGGGHEGRGGGMSYWRFLAMIATSTAVMFGLMYLNTYTWEHVLFSETRFWMAFVMGAAMAVIMLSFMLGMYTDGRRNLAILIGSAVIFAGALYLVRSQRTIADVAYMKAMIPHHSIAILTSERASILDPRASGLADDIIEAQRREIAEMKYLVSHIEEHGRLPAEPPATAGAPMAPVAEAIRNVAPELLVPHTLSEADRGNLPAHADGCTFDYTGAGLPVVVYNAESAALRLNGRLVMLPAVGADSWRDAGLSVTIRPLEDRDPASDGPVLAEMVFQVAALEHETGFHGFIRCGRGGAA